MIAIIQPSVTGLALVLSAFLLLPEADAQGEFVPVMYKRDRFEWVDAGHF